MRKGMIAFVVGALATGGAGFALAQDASDEEKAVTMVASEWADAWNAGEMKAIGGLYAEAADYVSLLGESVTGREQIEASFAEIHSTVYKGSKISIETTAIRFVKPDVAISDTAWEFTGVPKTEGPEMPSKGLSTVVLVKQDGQWKITAHRARVPLPPPE